MKPLYILGKLYLIPTTLGEMDPKAVLPTTIKRTLDFIDTYIVENEKVARKFIKSINPDIKQSTLKIDVLDKHNNFLNYDEFLNPCLSGKNIGLMSDAGCPAVADPGAIIVGLAHKKHIQVVPLVGPSSILLALMASGLNGQSFAFNGYLPIDSAQQKSTLKALEKLSKEKNQTQIFMDTPYRNIKLFDNVIQSLQPNTKLCIACDITLPTEYIKTLSINEWKKKKVDLHNRPAIFLIL